MLCGVDKSGAFSTLTDASFRVAGGYIAEIRQSLPCARRLTNGPLLSSGRGNRCFRRKLYVLQQKRQHKPQSK